jgi:hypothetical protein
MEALYGYENATLTDVDFIVERIEALKKRQRETGFRTTRSQTAILGKLQPEVLAEVLIKLQGGAK